jgi:predicted amidophosphoribosyltransferase
MLYPIQYLVDSIFPPTTHELLLRNVSANRFKQWYTVQTTGDVTYLSEYATPVIQAAIAACKFEHSYQAAKLLSTLVTTYSETLPPKKTLFIPIPLSKAREHKRGFNQVTRVLSYIGTLPYSYTVASNLLTRQLDTTPQTSLTRAKRLTNMSGAFVYQTKNHFLLDDIERIIICDDVLTTGTTLRAVKATLVPHIPTHIEIICLAWAH